MTRGPDGKEQRGYVNAPGLDTQDAWRAFYGTAPYVVSGGAAGAATRGAGLLAQAAGQGVAGAATSVAGDVAQMPMGSEQGIEGGKAAAMGAMGFGIPLASRAAGNAVSAIKERLAPQTGPLAGASPKAVRRVQEALSMDPSLDPQSIANASAQFGDELMLGDMGRTLQTDTARLARIPGSSDQVIGALAERAGGAKQRIAQALDQNLGPEINLPQELRQQKDAYSAAAKPFYDIFRGAAIKPTEKLYSILDAAKAAGAYDKALKKLQVKQLDPNAPQNTGQFLDLIKRELDGLAGQAKSAGNNTDFADLSNLARELRTEVDTILSPKDPSRSVWARGRSIAGQGLEGQDAAELGGQVFGGTARDPHLVADDLANMSVYGQQSYKAGARNKLRQVMGKSASNFGPKGDAAGRRALNSEFSRENIEQIAGKPASENIGKRVDAENHFAELYDMARGNSITSTMEASKARWPTPTEGKFASDAGKKGPAGLATEAVFKIADMLLGGQLKKAEARAALDGAKILTATGHKRDRIVNALFRHIEDRKAGRLSGKKFEKIVRGLLETSRVPAYQSAD